MARDLDILTMRRFYKEGKLDLTQLDDSFKEGAPPVLIFPTYILPEETVGSLSDYLKLQQDSQGNYPLLADVSDKLSGVSAHGEQWVSDCKAAITSIANLNSHLEGRFLVVDRSFTAYDQLRKGEGTVKCVDYEELRGHAKGELYDSCMNFLFDEVTAPELVPTVEQALELILPVLALHGVHSVPEIKLVPTERERKAISKTARHLMGIDELVGHINRMCSERVYYSA